VNRASLLSIAPNWLAIETFASPTKFAMIAMYVEAIMDSIEHEGREPDDWEAKHLVYAIHALVTEKYYGAITFSELALTDPTARPRRPTPTGQPVCLDDLRVAMAGVREHKSKP
jgi:hypothetical protein